jgi:REP element-mobilizing transposase RayT
VRNDNHQEQSICASASSAVQLNDNLAHHLGHIRRAPPRRKSPDVSLWCNELGDPFVESNQIREGIARDSLRGTVVHLTRDQQLHSQDVLSQLCIRSGWNLRACSAAPDHMHVLLDIIPSVHGEKVRRLLKRWLGESLTSKFGKPDSGTWWAKEGSNRAIHDECYLNNAYRYVFRQRAE